MPIDLEILTEIVRDFERRTVQRPKFFVMHPKDNSDLLRLIREDRVSFSPGQPVYLDGIPILTTTAVPEGSVYMSNQEPNEFFREPETVFNQRRPEIINSGLWTTFRANLGNIKAPVMDPLKEPEPKTFWDYVQEDD